PLSFAQQRLWVVDRIEPDSPAYNMPFPLRLRGGLELPVLRASLDALVERHESLRTTFPEEGGRPVQVVHPAAPVPLPMVDLRGLPEEARQPEAKRLSGAEAMRPFDLARGPVLRSTLVCLDEEDHVLLFTLHHIVSDGWSMQVLVREVSVLYAAFSRGEEPRLPALPVQYADFAVWQREWLSGEVLEGQIGFWRERLNGVPPLLEIPTDQPRRAGQSPLAATYPFTLSPELSQGLRELARREGATLFMTLLAGWQALLSKYSGQDDVVVGTPIAGRSRRETEGLIGFFINTLALRARLGADPTWSGLLEQVREETLGAYNHQDLPFERLVEELGVERSLTHTPVFQTTLTLNLFDGESSEPLELGALGLGSFGGGGGVAKFDLDLVFADAGEGLGGTLIYKRALFEAATMSRLAGHLETVLEAMVADPRQRLSELSLLRGAERVQVLEEWNATDRPYPAAPLLPERFAAQAARTPEAVALDCGGERLSYAGLERRSARLARALLRRGVGPEARVGVLLERSTALVVAQLAVLRAGAAYLPIDPAVPEERVAFMLADAGAPLVLAQAETAGRLGSFAGEVLRVDLLPEVTEEGDDPPAADLPNTLSPETLAYVIYTSGSAGTPKGVEVTHAGLLNLVHWHREAFGVTEADRATQLAGLGFDASAWELWPYLACGAAVHLVPEEETRTSPAALQALFLERGITVAFAPTPMAEALLALEWPAATGLRVLLTGGDALRVRPRADLPFTLVNNYGPTENTVVATSGPVRAGEAGAPSIGRVTGNVRAYVLDGHLGPVAAGMPGELCVGGAQVARGYLGRPELTAAQFVPDPFRKEAGARMYRTGDRVRWLAGGELEFLGRMDQQVKIRGFRVEPGEVEAVLSGLPQVREAVVMVREDEPGQKRLVGYVVPREGAELSTAELRARLGERLPEYMVPGAFVTLERLPLNASGKVDRRALPAPE
ncbi:MAG TPA: amino acid adenylation domain-containing protein, partial [Longimicrobiaceae bacterium]